MANFDSEIFGLVFPGFQGTQKIHAQNSRPELSAFLSNFTFLNPKLIHGDFLLTGETNISEQTSERAKGAAKASCGETVVQRVFLESPFLLCPLNVCS